VTGAITDAAAAAMMPEVEVNAVGVSELPTTQETETSPSYYQFACELPCTSMGVFYAGYGGSIGSYKFHWTCADCNPSCNPSPGSRRVPGSRPIGRRVVSGSV
jgi:hypothetical protein